ncbi:MAG TPA: IgGFc-binding protein [Polyangiaceae bacterium]
MRNAFLLLASTLLLVVPPSLAACGSSPHASSFTADDGGNGGDGSAGSSSGGGGNEAGPPINHYDGGTLTGDASGMCQNSCSADGKSVVSCVTGQTVQTCASGTTCLDGQCVDACGAAALEKSTIGCDYYAVDPDVIQEGQGACFAVYIANTSSNPVSINLEKDNLTYDATAVSAIPQGDGKAITYAPLPNGQIPPGQIAIVFLTQAPNPIGNMAVTCPVTPAINGTDSSVHGTGLGSAFHITTSQPVVAYDIFPYGGGDAAMTSATLLIPTSAWDTNYVAVNAFPQSQIAMSAGAMPSLDIIAMEDGTTVTMAPTVAVQPGNGVPGGQANTPQTYMLNKGQLLQFTQAEELTGSPIQSNKPIGVWGAASCLNIDVNTCCCDSAHQQLPPVKALGIEYTGVRYRNRQDEGGTTADGGVADGGGITVPEEMPPWRLVGAVNGTQLTWEPSTPQGAPTTLNLGTIATFNAAGPFVVKSQDAQHPFYMSAHMTGCETIFSASDCRGDAEFVDVVPAAQWLSSYTFFTDPTYPETNLVVVRHQDKGKFADVNLDCAGTLGGWKPIDQADTYEYTRIDLVRHDFIQQGNCDNGRHVMTSSVPFGLTVWGWGSAETGGAYNLPQAPGFYTQAVSYAYPAGASVAPINTVVVPPVSQ